VLRGAVRSITNLTQLSACAAPGSEDTKTADPRLVGLLKRAATSGFDPAGCRCGGERGRGAQMLHRILGQGALKANDRSGRLRLMTKTNSVGEAIAEHVAVGVIKRQGFQICADCDDSKPDLARSLANAGQPEAPRRSKPNRRRPRSECAPSRKHCGGRSPRTSTRPSKRRVGKLVIDLESAATRLKSPSSVSERPNMPTSRRRS